MLLKLFYKPFLLISIPQFEKMVTNSTDGALFADALDLVRANVAWYNKFVPDIESWLMS